MFDRSGAYTSDAYKEPERFAKVIACYALMSHLELGLNALIHRGGIVMYVVVKDQKIYLENKPIASQKVIPHNLAYKAMIELTKAG